MPVMNGLKLAEKIYALHANARIVFLTSYEKYALSSIKIGAYYYIIKDSYKEELIKLLERICKEEEENKDLIVTSNFVNETICFIFTIIPLSINTNR